jgi:hypothetical protein
VTVTSSYLLSRGGIQDQCYSYYGKREDETRFTEQQRAAKGMREHPQEQERSRTRPEETRKR